MYGCKYGHVWPIMLARLCIVTHSVTVTLASNKSGAAVSAAVLRWLEALFVDYVQPVKFPVFSCCGQIGQLLTLCRQTVCFGHVAVNLCVCMSWIHTWRNVNWLQHGLFVMLLSDWNGPCRAMGAECVCKVSSGLTCVSEESNTFAFNSLFVCNRWCRFLSFG